MSEAVVDKLLDAAFRELQHDTGPHDAEYAHQRASLRGEFRKILRQASIEKDGTK